jgi:predicted enzyme related to lactoylglutathione lyase
MPARVVSCVVAVLAIVGGWSVYAVAPSVAYRAELVLQLGVSDLDRAIRFYESTLEFKLTERRDDLGFAHIATNVPGLELGLSQSPKAAGTGSAVVNIGVVDVAAARQILESRGVSFPRPTHVIPGKVALADFSDPDGNRLRLAGPPPK